MRSLLRRRWVEVAWGLFALANLAVMSQAVQGTTIPFHFIWVSLTLVYGYRVWSPRTTAAVLAVVCATTGVVLVRAAFEPGGPGLDETTEVPLMGAMFLAMVWHARRRDAALAEARRLAEKDREFACDASHRLRSPIAVASGHAELIRAAHAGTQVGDDAAVVLDELDRLSRIAHRLLILASAEHPSFLHVEPVDVEDLVVGVGRRWGPTAARRWRIDPQADIWVSGDREQLAYALDALIENAVRHTSADGRIVVAARREEADVVLTVRDDGPGIDPGRVDDIFQRFVRVPGGPVGTGLGLPIVRAIAEAHGGTAAVVPSDTGAIFSIRLRAIDGGPTPDTGMPVHGGHTRRRLSTVAVHPH